MRPITWRTASLEMPVRVNATLEITDRAYVLEHGRVALSGPSREMKTNEHVRKAYLGF